MQQFKWILALGFSFSNTLFAEINIDSDDWFQIDTIIFEYLEPDTSENVVSEGKKSYPRNVLAVDENLKDFEKDDGSEARNQLLSEENGYSNANQNISFELERESARRFNRVLVEELIKKSSNNQSRDGYKKTPDISEDGFRAKVIQELVFQLNPFADGQLAFKNFSPLSDLAEIKDRIDRSSSMRVLDHKSWIQPIGPEQTSIMIQGGAEQEGKYEIDGFISIYKKRYLHVITDLWFSKSLTNNSEKIHFSNAGLGESKNAGLIRETLNSSAFHTFTMKQQRRVRANELHYLDHPFFGLVLKISRFKKDEHGN